MAPVISTIREPLRVINMEPGRESQGSTHHFDPGMLRSLARIQSGANPRAWLVPSVTTIASTAKHSPKRAPPGWAWPWR